MAERYETIGYTQYGIPKSRHVCDRCRWWQRCSCISELCSSLVGSVLTTRVAGSTFSSSTHTLLMAEAHTILKNSK